MSGTIGATRNEKLLSTIKGFCSHIKIDGEANTTPSDLLQIALMLSAVLLSILTIEVKRLLYAVLSFCGMCITIGALYWLLDAPYVAVFQLLIYAAGIVTLFIAALTLTTLKDSAK